MSVNFEIVGPIAPAVVPTVTELRKQQNKIRQLAGADVWVGPPRSSAPEVTITSLRNREQPSSIEVKLQVSFTGHGVLSEGEASECPSSAQEVLDKLSALQGLAYSFSQFPRLEPVLQAWIDEGCDLGMMYARVRGGYLSPALGLPDTAADRKQHDVEQRASALEPATDVVLRPNLPPRRVWDLYSNRVVPRHVAKTLDAAISHSWMAPARRRLVRTAINGRQWPVPIPDDTTLERVRIELLNMRMQYVWLDVLCLRQEDSTPEHEALRREEWKLDVPTIGAIYQGTMVIHYYSGLGRPFRVGDLNDERHWINRAWTLQEVSANRLIAGIVPDSPDPREEARDADEKRLFDAVTPLLAHAQSPGSIFPMLRAMRVRSATSEQDKVSGLAFSLGSGSSSLPAYTVGQEAELAWEALVRTMHARFRGDLLFRFPVPGDGKYKWYPSWRQVTNLSTVLPADDDAGSSIPVEICSHSRGACFRGGYRFNNCRLVGLIGATNGSDRHRLVVIPGPGAAEHRLPVQVVGDRPVADGTYTLVGSQSLQRWVAGIDSGEGTWKVVGAIEKVAAFFVMESDAHTFREGWVKAHTNLPLATSRFL